MLNRNLFKKISLLLLILGLVPTILFIVCCAKYYELDVQYFANKLPIYTIFIVCTVFIVVATIVASALLKKGELTTKYAPSNLAITFSGILGAISIVAYEVLDIISLLSDERIFNSPMYLFNPPSLSQKLFFDRLNTFRTLSCIVALFFVVYLLIASFKKSHSKLNVGFQFAVEIYLALLVLTTYFDKTHPINSPIVIMIQVAISAFMLFTLCEMRYKLGMAAPRAYSAFAVISFMTSLSIGLGLIFGAIFGTMSFDKMTMIGIFMFAMAIYTLARFIPVLNDKNEIIPEPVVFVEKTIDTQETDNTTEAE